RGKAGEAGLVPVGEAETAGGRADLALAEAGLQKREADAPAHGRSVAWPVIAGVVGRRAVGQPAQAHALSQRLKGAEQLLPAVEAAIRLVAEVLGHLCLVGFDLDQPGAQRARQRAGLLLL